MANKAHVTRLLESVEEWNRWRRENPRKEVVLSGANLRRTNLSGANLTASDLRWTNLTASDLHGADLSGANLSRAYLHDAVLHDAVLHDAVLHDAVLETADLRRADLRRADLSEADLSEADLSEADLSEADLSEARLFRANLYEANLSRARLYEVDLSWANLYEANLSQADFTQTRMDATILARVDLREVIGLETAYHIGPSEIAISTLYKSGGDIPNIFLRGCGVPDSLIDYARSLVAAERPIDYYSCFISYSSHDQALAERLHADLQAKGVRCWFAPHDMHIGDSLIDRIDQAIRLHEKLLLILSEWSVVSAWVGAEVKTALMRERNEGRTVLFPIRLDDSVLHSAEGWARQVQERHIGDFRQWKDHDAYQQSFTRLLRDLRAEGA